MFKKTVFVFICLLMLGCSDSSSVAIPDNVLSDEKMAAVLVDMELMEASMNVTGVSQQRIDLAGSNVALKIDILKKHNITVKQFEESFVFYTNHPMLLSEVYDIVIVTLSQMQAKAQHKK